MQHLTLPPGLIGKFGVVKLWPGVKVAEDEVIARLKLAAEKHRKGRALDFVCKLK